MKEESRKIKYTKKIIKDSFLSLLKEKPINKISVIEICKLADINRGTFYQHYENTDQLFDSIANELISKIIAIQKEDDFFDRMEKSLKIVYEDRDLAQVLLYNNWDKKIFEKLMYDLKQEDRFKGQIVGIGEVEYEYVYNALVSGCLSIIKTWMDHDFREPISFIINLMKSISN